MSDSTEATVVQQARAFVKSAVAKGGGDAACMVTLADAAASEAATDAAGVPAAGAIPSGDDDEMVMH